MIKLSSISKRYEGASAPVVDGIDMEVGAGEICVLLGPSGCGKTTTLKMINRLIQPTSGKIFIDGRDTDEFEVVELRRQIGYVIQQIGLFPNMTVEENISVVPRLLGWDKTRVQARVDELLGLVDLPGPTYAARMPSELSGGQRQRVGVARALAADPPVLLMDEPFGALDPITRRELRDAFRAIQQRLKKTVVIVTHDMHEALSLGDRVGVLADGRLHTIAPPEHLRQSDDPHIRDLLATEG